MDRTQAERQPFAPDVSTGAGDGYLWKPGDSPHVSINHRFQPSIGLGPFLSIPALADGAAAGVLLGFISRKAGRSARLLVMGVDELGFAARLGQSQPHA